MTSITGRSRWYMVWAFALGNDIVMATLTGTNYLRMINANNRDPSRGGMTGITGTAGSDVVGYFPGTDNSIVTTFTTANYL